MIDFERKGSVNLFGNIDFSFRRNFTLSMAFLLFFAKVAVDMFFFSLGKSDEIYSILFKLIISFCIIALLGFYFFRDFQKRIDTEDETSYSSFKSELIKIFALAVILLALGVFVPEELTFARLPSNQLTLLYFESYSFYGIFTGIFLLRFLYKWLWIHRHKTTKMYLNVFKFMFYILLVLEIPNHFNQSYEEVVQIPYIHQIMIAISIFLFLLMFFTSKKIDWIAVLPKGEKWKLILISIIAIIISSAVSSSAGYEYQGTGKLQHALMNFYGANAILAFPFGLAIAYFLRIFISSIASLPTSDIVVRKTNELSSLAYLNKVVAGKFDLNNLLESATKLALNACRANMAWTEVYNRDGSLRIAYSQLISIGLIDNLHETTNIRNFFASIDEPVLIESFTDIHEFDLSGLKKIIKAKSMIAIPLSASGERIGTLVLLHNDEYGFDTGYFNLLLAFRDNVNIALENSRLIEESIEKERYKKELFLAREIQQKLLPQQIPVIKNYSVSAFTIPADEVGGDYYDIVYLKNGKPCILIGDVSGKGMSAAFYMALLKGTVLASAKESEGPGDLLKKINSTLFKSMERQLFITMCALSIDDDNGGITLARAGHMPILNKSGDKIESILPSGIGIGLAESDIFDSNLIETKITLSKDDLILLFTDGIIELKNEQDEEFDINSLKQILKNSVYQSVEVLINELHSKMDDFRGKCSQCDDLTLMAISFNGMLE